MRTLYEANTSCHLNGEIVSSRLLLKRLVLFSLVLLFGGKGLGLVVSTKIPVVIVVVVWCELVRHL